MSQPVHPRPGPAPRRRRHGGAGHGSELMATAGIATAGTRRPVVMERTLSLLGVTQRLPDGQGHTAQLIYNSPTLSTVECAVPPGRYEALVTGRGSKDLSMSASTV